MYSMKSLSKLSSLSTRKLVPQQIVRLSLYSIEGGAMSVAVIRLAHIIRVIAFIRFLVFRYESFKTAQIARPPLPQYSQGLE